MKMKLLRSNSEQYWMVGYKKTRRQRNTFYNVLSPYLATLNKTKELDMKYRTDYRRMVFAWGSQTIKLICV